jgi:hypothetical protein
MGRYDSITWNIFMKASVIKLRFILFRKCVFVGYFHMKSLIIIAVVGEEDFILTSKRTIVKKINFSSGK